MVHYVKKKHRIKEQTVTGGGNFTQSTQGRPMEETDDSYTETYII